METDEEIMTTGNKKSYKKVVAQLYEFYLSGAITAPEDYVEWFDTIRSASKNDVIKIYINSPGGDLFTAIQFMRVLTETDAQVVISVEGACMSAATLIFMCGHQYEISPHSVFMFHNYSSGMAGKGGEMFDRMAHERIWSEKLFQDVYADFLNEREIKSILDNKDLWMDSDEVIKRLKKKIKKNEKESKDESKGLE